MKQVEGDAALACVQCEPAQAQLRRGLVVEERTTTAHVIAIGRLYLNHVCAETGKHPAAELALLTAQVQHANTFEGSRPTILLGSVGHDHSLLLGYLSGPNALVRSQPEDQGVPPGRQLNAV